MVLLLRILLGAFEAGCNPSNYAILMAYWGSSTRSGFAFGCYALGFAPLIAPLSLRCLPPALKTRPKIAVVILEVEEVC